IALGMALAFGFSAKRGLLPKSETERVKHHLAAVGLPIHLSSVRGALPDADRLMELIAQDKKVKRGKLTLILARGIGASFIESDFDAAEIPAFLAQKIAERALPTIGSPWWRFSFVSSSPPSSREVRPR